MEKYEPGLHKKISTIFNGVSIPKNDDTQQATTAVKKESLNDASSELPVMKQSVAPSLPHQQPAQPLPPAAPSVQPVATAAVAQNSWQTFLYQYWKRISNKLLASKPGVNANKQKIMLILTPCLIVIFIFVVIRLLRQPSPQAVQAQTNASEAAAVGNSVAASEEKINWHIPEPYPTTLRDPMKPGLSAGGQGEYGNLIVKGIVYSEDNPSAIISSQIVHQGNKISGATVTKINKNSVEFEMDGKKWTQEVQR